ncbi:succinylglutamate desuccinylase/aspartoacylase family protein [bacterium]|nr:succinylglutamate desuccinylase/aspartoacylase family protein [bacterium]
MKQPLRCVLPGLGLLVCLGASAENMTKELIMAGTPYQTVCYTKTGETPGGNLFIIGGCHGDEVAGYLAARRLKNWQITTGTLYLITDAHVAAIKRNARGHPGNMNKMFPGRANGSNMERLAYGIWSHIVKHHPRMLVTLHESIGFHRLEPRRYGQTLTYDTHELDETFRPMVLAVNKQIPNKDHHFALFVGPFPTCPTYCAYFQLSIPATSVETCRQMRLEERIQHQLLMCRAFMSACGLQWEEKPTTNARTSSPGSHPTNPFTMPTAQPSAVETPRMAPPASETPAAAPPFPAIQPATARPEPSAPPDPPTRSGLGINIIAVLCVAGGAGFVAYAVTALVLRRKSPGSIRGGSE